MLAALDVKILHLGNVRAGDKRLFPCAGQHDGVDAFHRGNFFKGAVKIFIHSGIERVQLLGSVDRHNRYIVFSFNDNEFHNCHFPSKNLSILISRIVLF